MTTQLRKAYNQLKKMGCPVFIRKDDEGKNVFRISAESASEEIWANYYDLGYPFISEKIEAVTKALGLTVEWDNPGSLSIWD